MNDINAFHIVFTTHNSRTSERMRRLKIKKGEPILLSLKEEIELTKIIGAEIKKSNIKCMAYNICQDHVHLILVDQEENIPNLIRMIKSNSSRLFHKLDIKFSYDRQAHKGKLWSQKYYYADLDIWTLGKLSKNKGHIYKAGYLENALVYIQGNRLKHKLAEDPELTKIIEGFVITQDQAFEIEE